MSLKNSEGSDMDKHVIAIIVSVLVAFGVIVSVTGLLGKYLGKSAELIVLVIIAIGLLGFLLYDKNKKE